MEVVPWLSHGRSGIALPRLAADTSLSGRMVKATRMRRTAPRPALPQPPWTGSLARQCRAVRVEFGRDCVGLLFSPLDTPSAMSDSIKELVEIPQAFVKEGTHVSIHHLHRASAKCGGSCAQLGSGSRNFR